MPEMGRTPIERLDRSLESWAATADKPRRAVSSTADELLQPAQLPEWAQPLEARTAVLAIVGSREFINPDAYAYALDELTRAVNLLEPRQIISGGAVGMDTFAEHFGHMRSIPVTVKLPQVKQWDGPRGFRARNHEIVDECTHLLSLRCPRSSTYGSGWTADQAQRMGKPVRRVSIDLTGLTISGDW